nr:hypothetical protein CFP56_28577 [Quercus suber]
MCTEFHLGHLQVAKFVPEILDRVKTDERGAEHANPLDTAHAPNRYARGHEPETPLGRKGIASLVVELGPTKHGGECEEQQHTVQQDEATDCGITVLEQDHHGHQPDRGLLEMQLLGSVVGKRYAERAKGRVELAHEGVVEFRGIGLAGLEFEGAIVACKITGQTYKHFTQRRVDIEVEFTFEVVGAEFAKMRLVPGDDGRKADFPQACEKGEEGEEKWCDEVLILVESLPDPIDELKGEAWGANTNVYRVDTFSSKHMQGSLELLSANHVEIAARIEPHYSNKVQCFCLGGGQARNICIRWTTWPHHTGGVRHRGRQRKRRLECKSSRGGMYRELMARR